MYSNICIHIYICTYIYIYTIYIYTIIRLNPPPKRIVEAGGTLKSLLIEDKKEVSKENFKNNEVLKILNSDSRDLRPDTGDDNPDKFSNSIKSGRHICVCLCTCVCVYIFICMYVHAFLYSPKHFCLL
jgi:hypothetical protein